MNRIYTINDFLKKTFGEKVIKLSINGGFTCPNRDGSKGYGGCTFCSATGSGEMADTVENIHKQIELLSDKWGSAKKYIAYFQSFTNTYAPVQRLRELYFKALSNPNIVGIAIATRPDCINDEILSLLDEINKNHFMWVELGLQTIHQKTAKSINRCYDLSTYDTTVKALNNLNIKYVTHLILGLPGENEDDMKSSLSYVCEKKPFGLKLHMLNIVKGSKMSVTHRDYSFFSSIEHYVGFVCDLIEMIPSDITVHRLNGDAPRSILISPEWSYKKRTILNSISKELQRRNSFQGKLCDIHC